MIRKLAATVAAALLLGACAQVSAGVAAHVGDHAIETSFLAGRVSRAFENQRFADQFPRDAVQRELLGRLIQARLTDIAAERLGVTVTQQMLDEALQRTIESNGGPQRYKEVLAAGGYPAEDIDEELRIAVTRTAVMDKLVEKDVVPEDRLRAEYRRRLREFDRAQIAHIRLRDARTAARVARLAKAPGADFAALAKRYSLDTETKERGGDLGSVGNGEGRFSRAFEQAVFRAGSGDVVGPIRDVTGGEARVVSFEIIRVVQRTTRTFEQVRQEVRLGLLAEPRQQRYDALIADLAKEFGVRVNPRFGRWDPAQRQVVADPASGLSSPAPEPGAGLPGLPGAGQPGQPGQGQPGQGQQGQQGQPGTGTGGP